MDKILACKILKTHGIHGVLKIKVFIENWDLYWNKIINLNNMPMDIMESKLFDKKHNYFLIKLKDVSRLEEAITFLGKEGYLATENLIPEQDESFYYYKLINLPVKDIQGNCIGTVEDIDNIGEGDVLVIRLNINKIVYLPFDLNTFPQVEKDQIIISQDGLNYIFD
jgi:16S rRNA processing protein RimM